jgi:dihydroorotate dehydrogenase
MMHGYPLVKKLCDELKDFMRKHNFSSIEDFRGYDFCHVSEIYVFLFQR